MLDELTSSCCVLLVGIGGLRAAAAFLACYPIKPSKPAHPILLMFPLFFLKDCMIASSECSHLTMVLNVGVTPRLFLISVHKSMFGLFHWFGFFFAPFSSPPAVSPLWNELPDGCFSGAFPGSWLFFPFSQIPARVLQALPSRAGSSGRAHPKCVSC